MSHLLIAFLIMGASFSHPVEITWDRSTLALVKESGGYGRMIRLESGSILCSYQYTRKVWVRTSKDNGRTWETEGLVAS